MRRRAAYLAVMFTIVLLLALDERLRDAWPLLPPPPPPPPLPLPLELDELAAEMAHGECWPTLLLPLRLDAPPPPPPPPGALLLPAAGELGLFFQGWKPLPTAASASGGGDLFDSLLHWAASMASGVPRRLG